MPTTLHPFLDFKVPKSPLHLSTSNLHILRAFRSTAHQQLKPKR